ncbi:hypothetical protein FB45DRAFT_1093316 [Roridomyces roridus]|uniref:Uncharacterized protein n=1 Tax=Roridomyces roridus TaxID=1738132 RepID=A0AAD7BHT6_9AGAR|nr:hypothetical protein FB45DRAFT_1093316 [Roridomyces roridus]
MDTEIPGPIMNAVEVRAPRVQPSRAAKDNRSTQRLTAMLLGNSYDYAITDDDDDDSLSHAGPHSQPPHFGCRQRGGSESGRNFQKQNLASNPSSNMLIPPKMKMGKNMSIGAFCLEHNVAAEVGDRLKAHGFRYSRSFQFVQLDELKEIGFMLGEIAELRAAVAEWVGV